LRFYCRTRNARQERAAGSVTTTPAHLSASLTADDLRRLQEAEEDEQLVRAVFSRIPDPAYAPGPSSSAAAAAAPDPKGKGKARAMPTDDDDASEDNDDEDVSASAIGELDAAGSTASAVEEPKTLSIKRKLDAIGGGDEPSLAALLSQKGLAPPTAKAAGGGFGFGQSSAAAAKKKKVGGLGIPGLVMKKKPTAK
jgi:uncharacterized phage protein gp47/JayE